MEGPGDIGYGPALDAIRRDQENVKRVLEALCRRSYNLATDAQHEIIVKVSDKGFDRAFEAD